SRRRHTRLQGDWSSDVCSSDLKRPFCTKTHRTGWEARPMGFCAAKWPFFAAVACLNSGGRIKQRFPAAAASFTPANDFCKTVFRSEERRVGKECRSWWSLCGGK